MRHHWSSHAGSVKLHSAARAGGVLAHGDASPSCPPAQRLARSSTRDGWLLGGRGGCSPSVGRCPSLRRHPNIL